MSESEKYEDEFSWALEKIIVEMKLTEYENKYLALLLVKVENLYKEANDIHELIWKIDEKIGYDKMDDKEVVLIALLFYLSNVVARKVNLDPYKVFGDMVKTLTDMMLKNFMFPYGDMMYKYEIKDGKLIAKPFAPRIPP